MAILRRGAALALLWTSLASCSKQKPPVEDVALVGTELMAHAPAPIDADSGSDETDPSAAWTMETADGTVRVNHRGAKVLSFHYLFWGKNYAWADPVIKSSRTSGGVSTFELVIDALSLRILGTVTKAAAGELAFDYEIIAGKDMDGIDGGGLEFNLNVDAMLSANGPPTLLPDQRGFSWDTAPGGITVAFEPRLQSAYFEQGNRSTIRCFLVSKQIKAGTRKAAMRIRLPQGGVVRKSADERYGLDDRATWYAETLTWDRWPVDVSFLNEKPAGKHGYVKADGERLVFQDGTPIRFWGANVQAYALFQGTKDDIANQAKRIAALGYNLVRIHHQDSPWVTPNVIDSLAGTTQKLDPRALERIDWWVKCLKDEGVYVWMDLHVGRQFAKNDNIDGFSELAKQQGSGKGFNYVNPRIEKLMQEFADQYLLRKNSYTGTLYVDEPTVVAVLVTNENDITFHFGQATLSDKGNPVHNKLFETLARQIARRAGLSATASLNVTEPGPAKIVLSEIEYLFNKRAIDHLRTKGVKTLVASTSFWGAENLYSLPPLAAGDIVDVHSYGTGESLGTNPRYEANWMAWIGAAQVAGKPLSVTEWNVEYPNRDRFVAPLYMAAISSLQGWDAPMIYGYAQSPIQAPEKPEPWSTWNDPAITALMPAAALMFRGRHVKEAAKTYRLDLTRENLYFQRTSPDTSVAIRTLVEQSKLTIGLPDIPELAWDAALSSKAGDAIAFTELARDFIPQGQNFVVSDTGEVKRDWSLGIETIDTPLSQAIVGWVGKRPLRLHDVSFDIQTPKAAVAVTSMDGKPIAASRKMLVTVVAQVASSPGGGLPFLAQPVEGTIALRTATPLRMIPVSPKANPASAPADRPVPIEPLRRDGEQIFRLARGMPTHWFMLVP